MSLKPREVNLYMDVAKRMSQMSYATRLKVGAVIVKDSNIISYGWNGTVPGRDNCCEYNDMSLNNGILHVVTRTKPDVIHAEENSLLKLARQGISGAGASMFCTHSPCIVCARMMVTVGIRELYYRDVYRDDGGLDFLKETLGFNVHHVPIESNV